MEKSNYQKAKEEGIKSFWQSDVSKYCDVTFYKEFEDQLSSFAEKIKEGRDKDIESKLRIYFDELIHIPNPQVTLENILKTLSSDSEIIEDMIDISITPPPLINEIE